MCRKTIDRDFKVNISVVIQLYALGPMVGITNENGMVSFGNVEVGKISTGSVNLKNNSHVCAVFQV